MVMVHKFLLDFVSNSLKSGMCISLHVFFCVASDGILSEARWLLDSGLLPNSNSATRAIGYRQVDEYFPDPFFLFYIYLLHIFKAYLFILFNSVLGQGYFY